MSAFGCDTSEQAYDRLVGLAKERLVQMRLSDDGNHVLFKYHRRVFWDNLWDADPLLQIARGLVFDVRLKSLVVHPFTKTYNPQEKAAPVVKANHEVVGVRKVNGFMAAVSKLGGLDSDVMVTSSGAFDSPFTRLARQVLFERVGLDQRYFSPGYTYLFEICHEDDKHVVPEFPGAYLIGQRRNEWGAVPMVEEALDVTFNLMRQRLVERRANVGEVLFRPDWEMATYGYFVEQARTVPHEGFMIRNVVGQHLVKLKSATYLGMKLLGRGNFFLSESFDRKKLLQNLDEEFHFLVDYIFDEYGVQQFRALDPKDRIPLLRQRISEKVHA